ncbi:MAG: hypothetical protein PVH40_09580, partial [Gemmatimonadales bacterium]
MSAAVRPALRPMLVAVALTSSWASFVGSQPLRVDLPSSYVSGYAEALKGEDLRYHSPLPWVNHSLLVRSLDRRQDIEWTTGAVPEGSTDETATFVFMAGIDVDGEPREFDLFVNGDSVLRFANPTVEQSHLVWDGVRGVRAEFRVTLVDKYGDLMGFVFLTVPSAFWRESRSLQLRVAGESAGTRTWFMVFKEPLVPGASLRNGPALLRSADGHRQVVRVDFLHLGEESRLRISSPIGTIDTTV